MKVQLLLPLVLLAAQMAGRHASEGAEEELSKKDKKILRLRAELEEKLADEKGNSPPMTIFPMGKLTPHYSTCNPTILEIFGISGPKMYRSRPATIEERSICRKNYESCCDYEGMIKATESMRQRLKTCTSYYSFVEKLLMLFRGQNFKYSFQRTDDWGACEASALGSLPEEIRSQFFEESFVKGHIKKIMELLDDYHDYIQNWEFLFGNIICSVCNPAEVRFWSLGKCNSDSGGKTKCYTDEELFEFRAKLMEKGIYINRNKDINKITSTLIIDDSAALFVLMQRDWEIRLLWSMIDFMIPLANLIRCVKNKEDDPDFVVDPIKRSKIKEDSIMVENCLNNGELSSCVKHFGFNVMRMEAKRVIFTQGQQLYRVLYFMFVTNNFPNKFEKSPYFEALSYKGDNYCKIFSPNPTATVHRMRKVRFVLSDAGARLSLTKINSKLIDYSSKGAWLVTAGVMQLLWGWVASAI